MNFVRKEMIRTVKRILRLLSAILVLTPLPAGCRKTEDSKEITAEVKVNGTPLSELHFAPSLTLACRGQKDPGDLFQRGMDGGWRRGIRVCR